MPTACPTSTVMKVPVFLAAIVAVTADSPHPTAAVSP